MSQDGTVALEECLVKHETEKAYLVEYEEEEYWLPKSQIVEEESDEIQLGETVTISVKRWLAEEKGLAARIEPERGW